MHNTMSYQIDGITFDESPKTITFNHRNKKDPSKSLGEVTMLKYFEAQYGIKLREHGQPLFFVNNRKGDGEPIYLPTEICFSASLPNDFTKDRQKMRDIQDYKICGAEIRMQKIQKLISKF